MGPTRTHLNVFPPPIRSHAIQLLIRQPPLSPPSPDPLIHRGKTVSHAGLGPNPVNDCLHRLHPRVPSALESRRSAHTQVSTPRPTLDFGHTTYGPNSSLTEPGSSDTPDPKFQRTMREEPVPVRSMNSAPHETQFCVARPCANSWSLRAATRRRALPFQTHSCHPPAKPTPAIWLHQLDTLFRNPTDDRACSCARNLSWRREDPSPITRE